MAKQCRMYAQPVIAGLNLVNTLYYVKFADYYNQLSQIYK